VNVVREDPKNRNLLYAGTEYAMFISLDGGKAWQRFRTGLRRSASTTSSCTPADNDLIIGTHGPEHLDPRRHQRAAADDHGGGGGRRHLFAPRPRWRGGTTSRRASPRAAASTSAAKNPAPGTAISYHLKSAPAGDVKITDHRRHGPASCVKWTARRTPV